VKASQGAVGIDDESIEMFEVNLKDNLYRIWNRGKRVAKAPFSEVVIMLGFVVA
jgi:hypothetical protein